MKVCSSVHGAQSGVPILTTTRSQNPRPAVWCVQPCVDHDEVALVDTARGAQVLVSVSLLFVEEFLAGSVFTPVEFSVAHERTK